MKMNFNPSLFTSAATLSTKTVLAVTLSLSGLAQAADYAWDGTTGNWADTTWTPGPITGPTASTDTASINAGTVTINSLTINSAIAINSGATVVANAVDGVGNVVFGGNLTGAGTLTKAGAWSLFLGGDNSGFSGTINASSSNIMFTADSAGSAAADLVITTGNIVNNQSGTGRVIQLGSLAGSGGRLGSNSSGSEVTFEIGGNGKSTAFSGQIVNTPPGWGGGTVSITKVGSGTLTLSGTNTYTGTTNVNDGVLTLQGFGGGGTTYNGGILSINGLSTLRVTGSRYNFGGKTFTFDSVGGGTIDAIASGAGGLVFTGGNSFTTTGGAQNTISGTRIAAENQGINLNGHTATFDVATGTDPTSDLKVTGTLWNGGGVVKNGTGRMEISAAQQHTGTTTVNEGTLILGDGTNNVGLSNSHDVVIASGAALQLNYPVGSPDSIDELSLGGVLQSPGIYGAGTYSGVTITGTGTLNVLNGPIADPFLAWIDSFFPGEADPLIIGAAADPDNDGIENLAEYVLKNGDPAASFTGILPTLDATGANFVFTYLRRAAATGTAQTFQYGSDLIGWTDVTVTDGGIVSITSPEDGIQQIVITVAKGTNTKLFGRLQVVK